VRKLALFVSLLLVLPALSLAAPAPSGLVKVKLETSLGTIVLELDQAKAPKTVANFLEYVRTGHYNMTIFHRVIPGFVIQGGGFALEGPPSSQEMVQRPTREPVVNEATNGLKNLRGSICMARTPVVDSATSQFFINLVDNARLDHQNTTPQGFGYCVFGKVVQGMEVVDAIAKVKTTNVGQYGDVPAQPVYLKQASVVPGEGLSARPPEPAKSAPTSTK
jgi:cyclophilin family peptidyl-prolyl cis-trans isomerase